MIGFLLPLVLKLGVSERLAKPIATAALVVAAIALLIVGFLLWDHFDDKAAVEADRATANVEAVTTAREADEAAHEAVAANKEEVEDGNDRARAAAEAGRDPLADALRSLRPRTGGGD